MIVVEYPVALVLKGWHLLLTALGIGPDQSWLISLVLLVITIRALLLPLYYRQIRSGRILANLRPQIRALEATYANRHDPASRKELMAKRKELQKENNYSMADGCMPIFVLLPVIMGLYRLLIRIARPSEGLQAAHEGFGPLSSADIDSFLRAEFAGVPLPAYFRMPVDQLQFLGTTRADVMHVVLPMAIFASIFTTSNWAYTMRRNLRTLERFSKDQAGLIYDALFKAICVEPPPAVSLPPPSLLTTKDQAEERPETRIGLKTFKVFLGEICTWARTERIVSNGFKVSPPAYRDVQTY